MGRRDWAGLKEGFRFYCAWLIWIINIFSLEWESIYFSFPFSFSSSSSLFFTYQGVTEWRLRSGIKGVYMYFPLEMGHSQRQFADNAPFTWEPKLSLARSR